MKTKLTLSIDKKAIHLLKRDAKLKGKSLSSYVEDLAYSKQGLPDKKKAAMLRLKELLDQAKPTKAKTKRTEEKERLAYLRRKYG